jgi:hypothetical protein
LKPSDVNQKLTLLKTIQNELAASSSEQLTNKARVFKITVLDPILGCLERHFNNNMEEFSAKWIKLAHTQFHKKCCGGKGLECQADN